MAPSSFERERRRRQEASPLSLPQQPSELSPSPLQHLSVSGPRPLPRSQGFSNLSQFVARSDSSSSSSSSSTSEMPRTPTPGGLGLGIDLGSGGRRDGWRGGSQLQQDSPTGGRTRGLHGPREFPSGLSSGERTPRSSRPVESPSSPAASLPFLFRPRILPPASAPPPLSFGRPSSVDVARAAALSALTMAERAGLPASATEGLQHALRVIPNDEERLYAAPTMAPEDVRKSNSELMMDIMGMLNDGQMETLGGHVPLPVQPTEEEKEKRRRKNKKKNDGRKAKKAASSDGEGGDVVEGESSGVEEEDVGDAKYTTPQGRSINRFKSYDSLGYGYGTASASASCSPTPTSRQPQLQSTFSPSPALTSSRSVQSLSSTGSTGFSIQPSRRDLTPQLDFTPRPDLTPRPGQFQANTSTPRTPAEASETSKHSFPVQFVVHQVRPPKPDGPAPAYPAPSLYFYHIVGNRSHFESSVVNRQSSRNPHCPRPPLYFFEDERACLKVLAEYKIKEVSCNHDGNLGLNCQRCRDYWTTFYELKVMPASLTPEERKRIIDGNRSLRTIRTELDNLMENELISNEIYDMMMSKLPAETPLNGSRPDVSRNTSAVESPPAYNSPAAPSLPSRQTARPEICRVKALYPYPANDANDCSFVVEDEIIVYEKVNDDWWMGKNVRSNKEGVFPAAYTILKATGTPLPYQGASMKTQPYGGGYQAQPQQQYQQQSPYQPSPSQSYSAPSQPSKGSEMGKKAGKKLGNAALFGAGATVGSKIVNAIF